MSFFSPFPIFYISRTSFLLCVTVSHCLDIIVAMYSYICLVLLFLVCLDGESTLPLSPLLVSPSVFLLLTFILLTLCPYRALQSSSSVCYIVLITCPLGPVLYALAGVDLPLCLFTQDPRVYL